MRYRILMHLDIDARSDHEAQEAAKKIEETLKNPIVKFSLQGDGIRPIEDLQSPRIYQPQRV